MTPEIVHRNQEKMIEVGQPMIKICGLKTAEDIIAAASLGADYLGMVIDFPKSPRSLSPEVAIAVTRSVREQAPDTADRLVGVFVDEPLEELFNVVQTCGLTTVQLHGSESSEVCAAIRAKGTRVLKVFRVGNNSLEDPTAAIQTYKGNIDQIVLDTYSSQRDGGGFGEAFDWEIAKTVQQQFGPVILAGGLSETNVRQAIEAVHPLMVDVSSGVETGPGIKDMTLVRRFIAACSAPTEMYPESIEVHESTSVDGMSIPYYLAHPGGEKDMCLLFVPGGVNGGMHEKKTGKYDPLYSNLFAFITSRGIGAGVVDRRGCFHPTRPDLTTALDMASDEEVGDILNVVQALKDHGYKRVVIVGNSRGALTTARILERNDPLIDAAVLISGFYDIQDQDTDDLVRRPKTLPTRQSLGRLPPDQFPYTERSPVFSNNLSALIPVLLLHGINDDIVNVSQTEKMYEALRKINPLNQISLYEDLPHKKEALDPSSSQGNKVLENIFAFVESL